MKSKKPKRDRDLKFKKNLDHTLHTLRNENKESNEEMKSGEEFEKSLSRRKGHKTKMHYDKASSYERGRKGAYARSFGDKKSKKENYEAEANLNDDQNEDLHLKKRKNKGKKNMAYHNVFMKDEYKKDLVKTIW